MKKNLIFYYLVDWFNVFAEIVPTIFPQIIEEIDEKKEDFQQK